ncbi:Uncharacterized protein PBTT_06852 [Plasmodiophora brassicae]|uniref:Uncharacterized protein n=1 Tax=Plasmodiophora brassicae TaxID=37360 RepID=A0A0G4J943_PLABS|nr:hypothetical protein PBRA_003518 [Plasmodiophora brassicae]SPQ99872.1 unnamed protein product [Plasmodiophora brassicae]
MMARRNGERLASAKAFISEQIRAGQEITVQQVQQEFADVATCRSIYRWIAQARAALENPGQVNMRSLARAYITSQIRAGRPCRVVDVLDTFPGVASTTTIYRWLNEAKRPESLSATALLWRIVDSDPSSHASPTKTKQDEQWDTIRQRHQQLQEAIVAMDEGDRQQQCRRLCEMFPDAPQDVIERRLRLHAEGATTASSPSSLSCCCDCGAWLDSDTSSWAPLSIRPPPWAVLGKYPASGTFVQVRKDASTGVDAVSICWSCAQAGERSQRGEGGDSDDEQPQVEMVGETPDTGDHHTAMALLDLFTSGPAA